MKSSVFVVAELLPRAFKSFAVLLIMHLVLGTGCDFLLEESDISELSNPVYRVFEGRLTYPTGESPYEILIGDVNRNGLRDIVTLDWDGETASVLLAVGGAYARPVSYPIGATPRAGVLVDLNGDGNLDIAAVNESLDQVTILYGIGDGTFSEPVVIALPAGARPLAIIAADLANDGFLDLITANPGTDTISVIENRGGGLFFDPVSILVGQQPSGVWAGRLTANPVMEILVANRTSNTLSVLEFTSLGYRQTGLIPCGNGPRHITAADLNLNGRLDLLVTNLNSGDLSIFFGLGEGQFSTETRFEFPGPVARLMVGDFNNNTIPDLAAVLYDRLGDDRQPASLFSIVQGDGTGGFRNLATYGAGWGAFGLAIADMNGNNRLDVVTSDLSRSTVSLAYNRGDGTFQSDQRFKVGRNPGPVALADFSQNGFLDIAVGNRDENTISVLRGVGNGTFELLTTILLPGSPLALAAGDLNGNGRQDLVVSLNQQFAVYVYINSGAGTFLPPTLFNLLDSMQAPTPQVLSIALGDVNNSGYLDIVAGNTKRDSVSVLLNNGAARFDTRVITPNVGNYPLDLHLKDLNRDGYLDLIFLSTNDPAVPTDGADPRVVRWLGKGDGSFDFDTHARFTTGGGPRMMAMGDISGNGRPDAVTVHTSSDSLYLLEGVSGVSFSPGARLSIGKTPVAVALADIRRNGRADLVCALRTGSVVVRFSRGGLAFEGVNNFIVYPGISQVFVADLNKDTFPELITVHAARNEIAVMRGRAFQ